MKACNAQHEGLQCLALRLAMRRNFNTTIDEGTIALIEKLAVGGKSKGAVVDEAVAMLATPKSDGFQVDVNRWFRETWARLDEILETVQSVGPASSQVPSTLATTANDGYPVVVSAGRAVLNASGGFDPTEIPGVSVGAPNLVGTAKCDHCGKFRAPRRVPLCSVCIEGGHSGGTRECGACADNSGTGAI